MVTGFLVNTTSLCPQHRLTSHVLLHHGIESHSAVSWRVARHTATPGSAGLMLGMCLCEAKGTVGLWKSM